MKLHSLTSSSFWEKLSPRFSQPSLSCHPPYTLSWHQNLPKRYHERSHIHTYLSMIQSSRKSSTEDLVAKQIGRWTSLIDEDSEDSQKLGCQVWQRSWRIGGRSSKPRLTLHGWFHSKKSKKYESMCMHNKIIGYKLLNINKY